MAASITVGHNPNQPWHGQEFMLRKFRLKDLHRHGFIDWINGLEMPPIDYTEDRGTSQLNDVDIHPVFRRGRWHNISDDDYVLLLPVLRVASKFLLEPSMMAWWHGLFSPVHNTLCDPSTHMKHPFAKLTVFDIQPWDPTRADSALAAPETLRKLDQMKDFVTWEFLKLDSQAALTRPVYRDGFYPGCTVASSLALNVEYLEAIRGNIDIKAFPKAANFGEEEALIRSMSSLVVSILHEFCHAVCHASTKKYRVPLNTEPFFRDYRINELGSSFERLIFGGLIWPLGLNTVAHGHSFSFPYGAKHVNWPGTARTGTSAGEILRGSPALWGETSNFCYVVPLDYFHKLFTEAFWNQKLPIGGIETSFKPDLRLGITQTYPGIKQLGALEAYARGVPKPTVQSAFPMLNDDFLKKAGFFIKDSNDGHIDSPETDGGFNTWP